MKHFDFFDALPTHRPLRLLLADGDMDMDTGEVANFLQRQGLHTAIVADRAEVLRRLSRQEPDLLILGRRVGDSDGFEVLQEIRRSSAVPVILAGGHDGEDVDRILGLELGADDYISGRVNRRELLARIRAVLRRMHSGRRAERSRRYEVDRWIFDQRDRALVAPSGEQIRLGKSEYSLLCAFVAAPRRILSREQLMQSTRVHEDIFDRSIDVQVLRLRRKLDTGRKGDSLIRTERGLGYALDADVRLL